MHIFRPDQGQHPVTEQPTVADPRSPFKADEVSPEASAELGAGDLVAWHRTDPYEGGEVVDHGVVLGVDGNDAHVAWFAHESVEFPASELERVGRI